MAKSSEVQKASKINQHGKLVRFPDSLLHLRVDEKANRQTMLMLWDGNRQVQEYTIDHVFTTVYEQDSFVPVARIVQLASHLEQKRLADIAYETRRFVRIGESEETINQRIADKSQPILKIYHYHCNHLGTPQELTSQDGDVVWLSYDRAWGGSFDSLYKQQFVDNFAVSENELQPFKFQGQSLDTETGLHYNRFRYYDSDVGMFISRDPIELLGGSNTFAYAPNPIGWIDPLGLANRENNGKYKAFTEYTVPEKFRYCSDKVQFSLANQSFINQLDTNPNFRKKMYSKYPELIEWRKTGDMTSSPNWGKGKDKAGLTWHHHEDTNKLVLVDFKDHNSNHSLYHPQKKGGRALWGGGRLGRRGKLDGATGKPKNCILKSEGDN